MVFLFLPKNRTPILSWFCPRFFASHAAIWHFSKNLSNDNILFKKTRPWKKLMVCNDYREFWTIRYCEFLWNTCFKVQIDEFFVKHAYRGSQDKMNVSWAGSGKGFRSYFLKDLKTRYILFFEIFWHLWKSMRIKKQKS